ncbi:nucleotidyltransferase domain-containing protein [Peloplasma aerotolerans]|uniref:Nucleotidyltransferase domain-containing protein n=1 Tax=Peloplasma aerotolerans TaxID=3044389 RepID=A0AAW6UAU6_9MOLU|nr:nucleotidyltransferase domain-containing protein [Mariniplasma sp. M4Ah]MDI6453794.1 nucleotidyltransferase domain-containing protein [Mariniplasma sp. M4Ah]
MDMIIKEARAEYGLTQKELSEITDIPLRTIENWESGKRTPSPWVEKMVYNYLKQYPKNQYGIITETKGIYEVNQIREALLPLTFKYDIKKIILYGSYAKGKQEPQSDIDLVVDGNIKGIKFFGLLENINNIFVKSVDLIHLSQINTNSEIYESIMQGIVLYER